MAKLSDLALRRKFDQQQGLCFICDEPMHREPYVKYDNPLGWNQDHLTPKKLGGIDGTSNIVLTHVKCNSRKGHELPTREDFRKFRKVFKRHAWGSPEYQRARSKRLARRRAKRQKKTAG